MAIDVIGRPLAEAEALLQAAQINYNTEISRPSRSFFKVDEGCLYVIRQRQREDGVLQLTLAARLRKGCLEWLIRLVMTAFLAVPVLGPVR